MARRGHDHFGSDQQTEANQLHPLARHSRALRHGRSTRTELRRYRSGRDLYVPVSREAKRHVLVSQPQSFPRTDWSVWCDRDRTQLSGPCAIRSRVRDPALRLDRYKPGDDLQQSEGRKRLLQLSPSDLSEFHPDCDAERLRPNAFRPTGMGEDGHEPHRHSGCNRGDLYLSAKWQPSQCQLDESVPGRRTHPSPLYQRFIHDLLRCSDSRSEDDGGAGRWQRYRAGRGG